MVGLGAAGHRGHADPHERRRAQHHRLRLARARSTRSAPTTSTASMPAMKRWYAESTNPDRREGEPNDAARGHGPVHRAQRARRRSGPSRWSAMNKDALVFAMANPTPEVTPEEVGAARARHGDRPLGLPEPDQQRPLLPGDLPRRARRPRRADHRGDEDGRRARRSPRSSRTSSCARTTSSPRSSTATSRPRSPTRSPTRRAAAGMATTDQNTIGFAAIDEQRIRPSAV